MDAPAPPSPLAPAPDPDSPDSPPGLPAKGGLAVPDDAALPTWDLPLLAGRLVEVRPARRPGPTRAPSRRSNKGAARPRIWQAHPAGDAASDAAGDAGPSRSHAGAALTLVADLVCRAQHRGVLVAWIGARESTFYPPDFDAAGIDLAALVVVRAPDPRSAARAADRLLRSGAFALVVLDLDARAFVPTALLSRLLGLAQKHDAAVVFLTDRPAGDPSLAPLVSLRLATSCRRGSDGRFACRATALKDKRRAPGWTIEEKFRGPPGLR